MNKSIITLAAIAGVALAAPAFADDTTTSETTSKVKVEHDANGAVKEKKTVTKEGTDANGEYTSSETKVKAKVDANGNGEKTTKTTTVDDPKGLFNKTKTVDKVTEKTKDGVTDTSEKKTVNGKTVENTKTSDTTGAATTTKTGN